MDQKNKILKKKTAAFPDEVETQGCASKRNWSKVTAFALGLLIVCLIILILCLLYLQLVNKTVAVEGSTVFLAEIEDNIWPWRLQFKELNIFDPGTSSHLSDIYVTPTANVKLYSRQTAFYSGTFYRANASVTCGQLFNLYQLQQLEYGVTARSGNETTTDGELLVFDDQQKYWYFVHGKEYLRESAVFRKTFSIGANNQPISTQFTFDTPVSHMYHYVTCAMPGNVTMNFWASVTRSYYDYNDFGPKQCSIQQNVDHTNSCTVSFPPGSSLTAFAYVNPDPTNNERITVLYTYKMLDLKPPVSTAQLFFVCVLIFFAMVSVVTFLGCCK